MREGEATVVGVPPLSLCAVPDLSSLPVADEDRGRYVRIREYARGGMGRIFIARDCQLGRDIALKELLPAGALDAPTRDDAPPGGSNSRMARFFQEACITGQLEHPSIVPVYELGRQPNGLPYYTMKLVRGRTLERAIAEAGSLRKRLDLLSHFLNLCQALAYAHSRGIVHRDVKPSNVMIGEFGETVLLDWGIAKTLAKPESPVSGMEAKDRGAVPVEELADRITCTGEYLGTPQYMAPEQARGQANRVTEASDVYALGVVLYELLTGSRCFTGDSAHEVLGKVLSGERPPIRSIEPAAPAELAAVCDHAMRERPEDRYSTAKELAEDIQRFQTGALVEAYEYRPLDRLRRFAWRYRAILGTSAVAAIMLLAMGVYAFVNALEERAQTEYALYVSSISLAKASVDNRRLDDAHHALEEAPAQYRHVEWGLLQRLSHPELLVLRGHNREVTYGEFSPDGAAIATCGRDGRVLLWDAQTGQIKATIVVSESDQVHRLDWSPDSQLLVTATKQQQLMIYDTKTGAAVRELIVPKGGYTPVFSPDGKMVAAATQDGKCITLFDAQTGEVIRTFQGPEDYQTRIAFSHDGRRIVSSVADGMLFVWDIEARLLWHSQEKAHVPKASWVVFSPDDRTLLTTGVDGLAKLWDAETGRLLRTFEGHGGSVSAACFSPDGARVLTASWDLTVRIWDVATGKQVSVLDGFSLPLGFIGPHPDGSRFVTNTAGNAAVVRPVIPFTERQTLSCQGAPVDIAAFSPDGTLLATGTGRIDGIGHNRVALWNTATCELIRLIEPDSSNLIESLCFLPDGKHMALSSDKSSALIYDIRSGALVRVFGKIDNSNQLAVSPDGRVLATCGPANSALLWDLASGEQRALLEGHTDLPSKMAFNSTGDVLATGSFDGTVRLWNVASGKEMRVLSADSEVLALAFSPVGQGLATGGRDCVIRLWNADTGSLAQTFEGHGGYVHALAFTADGHRLASGSKDNSVRIWNTATGKQLLLLDRHTSRVFTVAFSPDDRFLATGGEDKTTVLWPIAAWAPAE